MKSITAKCGIYCIENIANGKMYVGQSLDIQKRFNVHKHHLYWGTHKNSYLQNAYNKYGKDNFLFFIIHECSVSDLDYWEKFYIKKMNSRDDGYNLESGGISNRTHSPKTLLKMSASQKGKTFSDETRNRMSQSQKGKFRSEEFKKKVSDGHKGMKFSDEHRNNISKALLGHIGWNKGGTGKPHTDSTKRKLSEVLTGRKMSEESKQKMSKSQTGRRHSDDTKSKMSESRKRYWDRWRKDNES